MTLAVCPKYLQQSYLGLFWRQMLKQTRNFSQMAGIAEIRISHGTEILHGFDVKFNFITPRIMRGVLFFLK